MTVEEEIVHYLESSPPYRERKARGRLICRLALKSLGISNKFINKEPLTETDLIQFGIKFDTYRRAWDHVTKEVPELRGEDYDQGKILAQEKQISLGYEQGFHKNVQQLKKIV